jgi:uncharacterized RDD family membrane protein YckC
MDEQHSDRRRVVATATESPPLAQHLLLSRASSPTYAGFWRRFLASLIDGVALSFALFPLELVLSLILERLVEAGATADGLWPDMAVWLVPYTMLCIVPDWLYFALLEGSPWRATLGKRVLGMAVTDLGGNRISFGRATRRFFSSYVSVILLGLGYLIQPFTAKRQALHDIIAGTLVVRT